MSQNNILKSKTSQNNLHFKIMNKLVTSCHIIKIVVTNYSYKLNVKIMVDDYDFKTLVINHGFNFKFKIIITNYDFKFLKMFKTVFSNYVLCDVAKKTLDLGFRYYF